MSDLSVRPYNEGQQRATDALLRSLGGFIVYLRFSLNAVAGADAEQLGLSVPSFQDLPLSPVVFRKTRATMVEGDTSRSELLISGSSVAAAVSARQVDSADVLFALAMGIRVNDAFFLIESSPSAGWSGNACLYRILLRETIPDVAGEILS